MNEVLKHQFDFITQKLENNYEQQQQIKELTKLNEDSFEEIQLLKDDLQNKILSEDQLK